MQRGDSWLTQESIQWTLLNMQQHWPGLQVFRRPSLKTDSLIWYRTVCTEHDNFLHCKPRHICYTLPHFGEDEWKKDEEVFKDTNVKRKYQLQLSFMSCTECWWCNSISGIIFYFVQHFATHFSRWQCFIQLNSLKVVYRLNLRLYSGQWLKTY